MEWGLFVSALGIGLVIGLAIAAPVGPIGLLVIERSLRHGFAAGLATGLGAAVADALYGAVGALGVTALVSLLQAARVPMVLGGSAFLLWLAWRTLRAPVVSPDAVRPEPRGSLWAAFGSTVLLTLANPATVLSFVAIFGTLAGAMPVGAGVAKAVWMVAGVFCGSALWWLLLAGGVARLRHRLGAGARRRVAWASALLLAGFALLQLARLVGPR